MRKQMSMGPGMLPVVVAVLVFSSRAVAQERTPPGLASLEIQKTQLEIQKLQQELAEKHQASEVPGWVPVVISLALGTASIFASIRIGRDAARHATRDMLDQAIHEKRIE